MKHPTSLMLTWALVYLPVSGDGICKSDANITLNIRSVIEQGNTALIYDHRRAAPALDVAIEYAKDSIFPDAIQLKFFYKDGGSACTAINKAVQSALDWVDEEVKCDIYIGPGNIRGIITGNKYFQRSSKILVGCNQVVADPYQIAIYSNSPVIGCPSVNIEGNTGLKRSEMHMLI